MNIWHPTWDWPLIPSDRYQPHGTDYLRVNCTIFVLLINLGWFTIQRLMVTDKNKNAALNLFWPNWEPLDPCWLFTFNCKLIYIKYNEKIAFLIRIRHISTAQEPHVSIAYHTRQCRYRTCPSPLKVLLDSIGLNRYFMCGLRNLNSVQPLSLHRPALCPLEVASMQIWCTFLPIWSSWASSPDALSVRLLDSLNQQ